MKFQDAPMTMQEALEADGEKLRQLTGEDHGPWDFSGKGNEMTDVPEDVKALAEVYAKLCFRFGDDVSEEDVREAIEDAVMADRAALTPKEQK